MKCAHCGRSLDKPTRSIQTRGGLLHFGPVRARRVFILPTRTKHAVIGFKALRKEIDPAQMELEGLAAHP